MSSLMFKNADKADIYVMTLALSKLDKLNDVA